MVYIHGEVLYLDGHIPVRSASSKHAIKSIEDEMHGLYRRRHIIYESIYT